jgi:hypothetical protein
MLTRAGSGRVVCCVGDAPKECAVDFRTPCSAAGSILPQGFRVTVVTDLLNQNMPLEDVQY